MSKPKCDDIKFAHAWEHPLLTGGRSGFGLGIPDTKERFCQNCGKRQHLVYVGAVKGAPGVPLAAHYEWKDVL